VRMVNLLVQEVVQSKCGRTTGMLPLVREAMADSNIRFVLICREKDEDDAETKKLRGALASMLQSLHKLISHHNVIAMLMSAFLRSLLAVLPIYQQVPLYPKRQI